jgi:hypothetical protein
MDYALKERIGKPELFTGRKKELDYFLKWINDIKDEKSQSTAIYLFIMRSRKMIYGWWIFAGIFSLLLFISTLPSNPGNPTILPRREKTILKKREPLL